MKPNKVNIIHTKECCHAIILVFLFSNFILKFCLKNPATTHEVSPKVQLRKDLRPIHVQLVAASHPSVALAPCDRRRRHHRRRWNREETGRQKGP